MIFGFVVLLSSLARVADLTKCLLLNDESCMVRPTIIDMNPVELKYYPFMISLNKCTGICNILSPKNKSITTDLKRAIQKTAKATGDVKVFSMITNKDEAKAMTEHISCDCKCKFNSTTCNSNQKWNNKTCMVM